MATTPLALVVSLVGLLRGSGKPAAIGGLVISGLISLLIAFPLILRLFL